MNYLQTNKYGIKIRNDFSLCFSEWLNDKIKKDHLQKLGKNTINYVDNNEKRHPYEQKPINNNNNANNKENIPSGYKYSPTMVEIDFDKKYSLPTQKRKTFVKQKTVERNNKKEELKLKLAKVEEKMKLIKSR